MLQVSPMAVGKLKEVMSQEGESGGSLRVIAMPGQGGGLQYMLTMEKETQSDDTVLKMEGLNLLVDSDSAPFLEEAVIDYVEQLGGRVGFVINNPMFASAGGCGCGSGGGGCGSGGCGCGESHGESHGHGQETGGGCGCGQSSGGCGCGHGH